MLKFSFSIHGQFFSWILGIIFSQFKEIKICRSVFSSIIYIWSDIHTHTHTHTHIYIITIIFSCCPHGYPWPSLATPLYRSLLPAGPQGYAPYPHRAVVRASRSAFARPCEGVHWSTSLISSSLLLRQCLACLVRLTWIVFVMGSRWPYSCCFVGCYLQVLFNKKQEYPIYDEVVMILFEDSKSAQCMKINKFLSEKISM